MGYKSSVAEYGFSAPKLRGCEFPTEDNGRTRPTRETMRRWDEWGEHHPKINTGLSKIKILRGKGKKKKVIKTGRIMKMPKLQTGSAYGVSHKPSAPRKFVAVQ